MNQMTWVIYMLTAKILIQEAQLERVQQQLDWLTESVDQLQQVTCCNPPQMI